MTIAWTKKWSSSDDGTILDGADLGVVQDDIDAGFGGNALTIQGMNIAAGTSGDDGKYISYQYSTNRLIYVAASAVVVPTGGIIMWSGAIAAVPAGWYFCNGSNGTPDLRDYFIVGATSDDAGVAKSNITGSLLKSHANGVMPAHTHTYYRGQLNNESDGLSQAFKTDAETNTGSTGTGSKNIAVFYALAYIMKG